MNDDAMMMIRRCDLLTEACTWHTTHSHILQLVSNPLIVECLSFYEYEQFWTVLRDFGKSVHYVSNESLPSFLFAGLAKLLSTFFLAKLHCHIFHKCNGVNSLHR